MGRPRPLPALASERLITRGHFGDGLARFPRPEPERPMTRQYEVIDTSGTDRPFGTTHYEVIDTSGRHLGDLGDGHLGAKHLGGPVSRGLPSVKSPPNDVARRGR
jgi:hypothetical protein